MNALSPHILKRAVRRDGTTHLPWPPLADLLHTERPGRRAHAILNTLTDAGHTALLVGGCVRDSLLGLKPKEYDIATSARPEEVEAVFRRTLPVGRSFGVVMVMIGNERYEVATFRTDLSYSDGRHPDAVAFSDRKTDAHRRDFTVNALYYDQQAREVIDDVGGLADLTEGIIRAIGDPEARFAEDRLRMMRAARFAARLGFEIDTRTAEAARRHAAELSAVSAERIQEELRKIMNARQPAEGVRLLDELRLLEQVLPETVEMKSCEQPPKYHPEGDVFVHSVLALEKLPPNPPFVLALATFLHDVGKPEAARRTERMRFPKHSQIGQDRTEEICQRLRMSRSETARVCWLVKRHMMFKDARKMRKSTLKRLVRHEDFDLLAELHRADALASWGNLDNYEFVMEFARNLTPEQKRPPRLITGHDLIDAGYRPGPGFQKVLQEVEDAQLEGAVRTRAEALELAKRVAEEADLERRAAD